jgi:hypothetical protein
MREAARKADLYDRREARVQEYVQVVEEHNAMMLTC